MSRCRETRCCRRAARRRTLRPDPYRAHNVQWCTLSPNGGAATSSGTSSWTRTASTAAAPHARPTSAIAGGRTCAAPSTTVRPSMMRSRPRALRRPAAFVAPTLIHTLWVSALGSRTGTDAFTCAHAAPAASSAGGSHAQLPSPTSTRVALPTSMQRTSPVSEVGDSGTKVGDADGEDPGEAGGETDGGGEGAADGGGRGRGRAEYVRLASGPTGGAGVLADPVAPASGCRGPRC